MKHFKLLLIVIFAFSASKSFSQDYIINQNNDTISCKIKKGGFNGRWQYKAKGDSSFIKIEPKFVKEYFLAKDSSKWVYVILPDTNYYDYVQLLERGKINLYKRTKHLETRHFNTSLVQKSSQTFLYATDNKGMLKEVYNDWSGENLAVIFQSKKADKNTFIELIADNPRVTSTFNQLKGRYTPEVIQTRILAYNQDAKIGQK